MRIEHIALNVPEPAAMASWYAEKLDMRIVDSNDDAPFGQFVADDSGCMLELYRNDAFCIPDYANQPPAIVHLAFVSADPPADAARLVAGGATLINDETAADGSHILTLRDPWGLAIQLCRRTEPPR
jgi:catechol 2,3-dioxygenase-like lactoylglutathione lyase family enzyme